MANLPDQPAGVIERALASLRARIRLWLVFDRATAILGVTLSVAIGLGLLDFAIRMPGLMRLALLLIGAALVVAACRRLLVPAARFRPSLTDVALRVEQTPVGAPVRGLLASGLELSTKSSPLSQDVVRASLAAFSRLSIRDVVRPIGGSKRGSTTLLASIVPLAILCLVAPTMTLIGARRVLTPWTDAQWPSRTAVLNATTANAHALGAALPLRALVTRTNRGVGDTRVAAKYRVTVDGVTGSTATTLLSSQGLRGDATPRGELYERLLDARALVEPRTSGAASGSRATLEYWFETADAATDAATIELVEPPIITRVEARVTPPAYVGTASLGELISGAHDLGAGRSDATPLSPVLAGSRVALTLTLSKPVPIAEGAGFLRKLLAGTEPPSGMMLANASAKSSSTLTLSFAAREPLRTAVVVEDEFGIGSPEPTTLLIGVVTDKAPTASVVEPGQDETVLASAVLDVSGEGRDDVGLARLTLEAQTLRGRPDSPGAPPEPAGQPASLAAREVAADAEETRTVRAPATIELADYSLKPGDELHLTAVAQDRFALEGESHAPVISAPRKLRIISEGQFVEQVLAELAGLRTAAIRLDADQAKLRTRAEGLDQPGGSDKAQGLKNEQDALTQRLSPPASLVKKLAERVDKNALPDRTVREMLRDVGDLLDQAADRSREAAQSLNESRKPEGESPADPAATEKARAAQSQVRDAMSRIASILDQGKDGWATRREIEKMLEDQRRLSNETRDLSRETGGKKASELTNDQKAALERLAQAQQELAQRARAATDALQDRSKKLEATDPAQSEAMKSAADESAREQLADTMQNASKSAGENQTATANDFQKKAEETLERMLQELDKGTKRRDESLRRQLADLVQQIEDLMGRQNAELAALADKSKLAPGETLDARQIQLNQDTIAVTDAARAVKEGGGPIADELETASNRQASAVQSLRLAPADEPGADRSQRDALSHLTEARDLAKKLRDQAAKREEDRKREELKRAYDKALQEQIAIRGDTAGFVGKELSRRDRAAVRTLGEKQEQLRATLKELQSKTKELSDEGVFRFSHDRLDTLMQRSEAALKEGIASKDVDSWQASSATVLRSLVEALSQSPDEKDFREAQGGNSGGGGQNGGPRPIIPPIAELKLLRAMQQDAALRTRSLAEAAAPNAAEIDEVGSLQRDLAKQGSALIKKLSEQQGANGPKLEEMRPGVPPQPPEPPKNEPEPKPREARP
jgi:hypothetical protein